MAHENSETVERDGRYYNVYGKGTEKAGEALPLLHDFEQESYDTEAEAVAAAKKRSDLYRPKKKIPSNPSSAPRGIQAGFGGIARAARGMPSVSGIA